MTLPILVYCGLVGRFTFASLYQILMIFICFGIFPFDCTSFSTFITPGSRDIVQVVQTVQIDLQKFRFTAPGSNLAFVLKNIAHNFYKIQKGLVIEFYKNNTVNKFVTFLLGFSIFSPAHGVLVSVMQYSRACFSHEWPVLSSTFQ